VFQNEDDMTEKTIEFTLKGCPTAPRDAEKKLVKLGPAGIQAVRDFDAGCADLQRRFTEELASLDVDFRARLVADTGEEALRDGQFQIDREYLDLEIAVVHLSSPDPDPAPEVVATQAA